MLRFSGVRVGFISEEWVALDWLLKQAMELPELQTLLQNSSSIMA